MARGNNNRGPGGTRGSSRGRSFPGRGGRGGRGGGRGRGREGGRGRGGAPSVDDHDFAVQMWPDGLTYNGTPRARGRGRGSYHGTGRDSPAIRGTDSPRGRGSFRGRGRGDATDAYGSPRGRGRSSRGQPNSKFRAGAPLSKLLYEDRPLLKPITFVRSVYTATLFQEEEDILQPLVEPVADDEKSHVPTADQVARVFGGETTGEDGEDGSEDEKQLAETDFADVGKMQATVDAIAATRRGEQGIASETRMEESFVGFYVDTTPAPVAARPTPTVATAQMEGALGDDDEEIIVYVAPHPRIGLSRATTPAPVTSAVEFITTTSILTGRELTERHTTANTAIATLPSVIETDLLSEEPSAHENTQEVPASATKPQDTKAGTIPEPPSLDSISFSFESSSRKKQTRKLFPVGGPRSLLQRSKKPRRRMPRHLGAFGAAVSEAQLQREGRARDPREAEQRRGDSDVNFGESSDDGVEGISNGLGAMDLDADAEISVEAMKSFVKSMSADGSRHITIDDIADEERMKVEDAEHQKRGSSEESEADDSGEGEDVEDESEDDDEDGSDEAVVHAAERELMGEDRESEDDGEEEDEEEYTSSDDGNSPKAGFQVRLAKMRARQSGRTDGKGKGRQVEESSDEDMDINVTWADDDEGYIAEIQNKLDANAHILSNGDRGARQELFKAVENGDFEDDEFAAMMKPAGRKKDKHIPAALQEQWEKDRQKKAENKRKRREDKLAAAADPLAMHKGGKKGRKAMLAAARLESHIEVENRIVDFASLEAQIRRFLFDIGGKDTMALPPCDKATRKRIHELAEAFSLKSESKGKGAGRYTTLVKTSRSGLGINEKKVSRILKTSKGNTWDAPDGGKGKGKGRVQSLAKHREGEEVGKAAPKIGESNIGFRMLASMGWAEGDRIGLSGGLDVPLVAKMKKTKLGLGATM